MYVYVVLKVTQLLLARQWLHARLVSQTRSETSEPPILLHLEGLREHFWLTIQVQLPHSEWALQSGPPAGCLQDRVIHILSESFRLGIRRTVCGMQMHFQR
jgi:hypothetical protein